MGNIGTLLNETEARMTDAITAMKREFASVRTGKASPALVEGLMVEYYGSSMRLRDIAGITTPEARLLVIQPWDKNALPAIEKAIRTSELGISPVTDGRVIRLPIPELSEERRKDLIRVVRHRAETARVEIRTIRRDANEAAKAAEKKAEITEDELHRMSKEIQDLTDLYIEEVGTLLEAKETELLQV